MSFLDSRDCGNYLHALIPVKGTTVGNFLLVGRRAWNLKDGLASAKGLVG